MSGTFWMNQTALSLRWKQCFSNKCETTCSIWILNMIMNIFMSL